MLQSLIQVIVTILTVFGLSVLFQPQGEQIAGVMILGFVAGILARTSYKTKEDE